jgi:hypothetical protein
MLRSRGVTRRPKILNYSKMLKADIDSAMPAFARLFVSVRYKATSPQLA